MVLGKEKTFMHNIKNPEKVLYPELSYEIMGSLFEVYKEIGPGHHEKYYQRSIAEELKRRGIKFQEQSYIPLLYKDKIVGRLFIDFLIEEIVVLEIKKGANFSKKHIDQVLKYLKNKDCKLAILANFSQNGVQYKRIVNFS